MHPGYVQLSCDMAQVLVANLAADAGGRHHEQQTHANPCSDYHM